MSTPQGGHDVHLLDLLSDLLGDLEGESFAGKIWRVVRKGRSPLDGSLGSGRWNPSDLNVLYGALEADGALAEIYHHMSLGQPVFPSRMQHGLYELDVVAQKTLVFANLDQLSKLGVEAAKYKELLYARTQEIASAAAFLGFDGLIAPSARWDCQNIVLFLDNYAIKDLTLVSKSDVDWKAWIARNRSKAIR